MHAYDGPSGWEREGGYGNGQDMPIIALIYALYPQKNATRRFGGARKIAISEIKTCRRHVSTRYIGRRSRYARRREKCDRTFK